MCDDYEELSIQDEIENATGRALSEIQSLELQNARLRNENEKLRASGKDIARQLESAQAEIAILRKLYPDAREIDAEEIRLWAINDPENAALSRWGLR